MTGLPLPNGDLRNRPLESSVDRLVSQSHRAAVLLGGPVPYPDETSFGERRDLPQGV
jgi:hypothetical protein